MTSENVYNGFIGAVFIDADYNTYKKAYEKKDED